MKGVTTYYFQGEASFCIWQARLRDEMPQADGNANPILWWSNCLRCNDMVVCGLDTKKETVMITRQHAEKCLDQEIERLR